MDGKTVNLLSTALKIALGVLLVLTSTVAPANPASPTTLTIDVVLSMTGAGAALGKDESLAFAIFEKTSNAKGGINGQPVHFEIHDDATNPQVAVQLASAILARAPAVFMGSSLAASCAAMAALVPQGPVQFCLSPAFEPKNGAYTFGAGGSVGYLLPASFNYIRNGGYTRVASIATSDASGVSGERSMDDAIALPENRNIKLVAREHFAVGDISVAAQIARIAASGAQLVCLTASSVVVSRWDPKLAYWIPVSDGGGAPLR